MAGAAQFWKRLRAAAKGDVVSAASSAPRLVAAPSKTDRTSSSL